METIKMANVSKEWETIALFLRWLWSEGVVLCKFDGTKLVPDKETATDKLFRYFDINKERFEKEREAILEKIGGYIEDQN